MPTTETNTGWALEVVRGREAGRRYVLAPGETTLGNEAGGPNVLNLADQEADSPRKMAGRNAVVTVSPSGPTVRDLDSPGGTFVNRRRLFTGQVQALKPGDVVQLGAVQLAVATHVVEAARPAPKPAKPAPAAPPSRPTPKPVAPVSGPPKPAPPPATRPAPPPQPPAPPPPSARAPMPVPYAFPGGAACRTWDDFLTLAAQKWTLVRDELASGRLTEHLRRIRRDDLVPAREPGWDADETLDAWLAKLPTTGPNAPELDVHPDALVVRTATRGGTVRRPIRVGNVGFRLLRATLVAEGPGVRIVGDPKLQIVDEREVQVDVDLPDSAEDATVGAVLIRSDGGTKRVEVRVERPPAYAEPDAGTLPDDFPAISGGALGDRIGGLSLLARLALFPIGLVALRGLLGLASGLPWFAKAGGSPGLAAPAALLSGLGFGTGLVNGLRRGEGFDPPASGLAGAGLGLLASALGFATVQSVEAPLGSLVANPVGAAILWAAIGVGLAWASMVVFPPRSAEARS